MIEWFPYERAPLGRTRLRYVDLDAVLTDGKVERASKAPGFVLLYYGEETEIVFVVGGEPVTAVRLSDRGRSVVPLTAVARRAAAEREWADVAYFHAPEPQLRAMYATAGHEPDLQAQTLDAAHPAHIFTIARERAYTGVLEFAEKNRKVHYLTFVEGLPMHAFFADQRRASDVRENESLSSRIERLFQPVRVEGMRATGYPLVERIPVQAPPALCDVYGDLIAAAISATEGATGREAAVDVFSSALDGVRAKQPALRGYALTAAGRLEGESVAPAEEMTESVAALLFEALTQAERAGAPSAVTTLEEISRHNRFILEANGFFQRFPWPLHV